MPHHEDDWYEEYLEAFDGARGAEFGWYEYGVWHSWAREGLLPLSPMREGSTIPRIPPEVTHISVMLPSGATYVAPIPEGFPREPTLRVYPVETREPTPIPR